MSCSKAETLDLASFIVDRGAAEWAEFVDHYPRCSECSAALAELGDVTVELEALGHAPAHPEPERLVDFAIASSAIPIDESASIQAHLDGCVYCRDELAALRAFDFGALPQHIARASAAAERPSWMATWLEPLFAWRPTPVLVATAALAAVVGITFTLLRASEPAAPIDGSDHTRVAREATPAEVPTALAGAGAEPRAPIADPTSLAANDPIVVPEPGTDLDPVASPDTPAFPAQPPTPSSGAQQAAPLRVAEVQASPPDPGEADTPALPKPAAHDSNIALAEVGEASGRVAEQEELLLAAHFPTGSPVYIPDSTLMDGVMADVRLHTVVRGGKDTLPAIRALAPLHIGATASTSPTLYWHLSSQGPAPVELSLLDEEGIEPLLSIELEPPIAAGLHAIDLSAHALVLDAGATYTWLAAQIVDPAQRELDHVASAAIRYAPPEAMARERLAAASIAERAHTEAELGYWYDAFATLVALRAKHPQETRLRDFEAALLEQVGLPEVVATLER